MSNLTQSDLDYVIALAGCSLATTSKKDNWVENSPSGELPEYICQIARSVKKTGKTTSQAIAIAVSRVKQWASGGENVNSDTRAKAAKALAAWERMKASSKSKKVASRASLTNRLESVRSIEVLAFCGPAFSMDKIRSEYDKVLRDARNAARQAGADYDSLPWMYVKEVWNTHIIVQRDSGDNLFKIDYTIDDNGKPVFGKPVEVVMEYVEAGKSISDSDLEPAFD